MRKDVYVIGPLNVDLLITGSAPTQIEALTHWVGPSNVMLMAAGSAGYVVQDLAKLHWQAGVLSTLSDDAFGDAILRKLREAGVDVSLVNRQKDTLSGIGIYILLFGSKKRPLTYRLPTHLPWPIRFSAEQTKTLLEAHHLHCAGYLHFPDMWNNAMSDLFCQAKQHGLSTSLDPQFPLFPIEKPWIEPIAELLRYIDLLLLDEDEARQVAQKSDLFDAIRILKAYGPQVVAIKRGAHGSIIIEAERIYEQPAMPVPEEEIVESIGAGDAYDAGMITGLLAGWPVQRSARFATAAAASTLRGSGGTQSLASREVLEQASLDG